MSFASPQAWNDMFANRPGKPQFLKDSVWWQRIPGQPHDNIATAIDPAQHSQIRKIFAPAFSARALRAQEPVLQKYVSDMPSFRLRCGTNTREKADLVELLPREMAIDLERQHTRIDDPHVLCSVDDELGIDHPAELLAHHGTSGYRMVVGGDSCSGQLRGFRQR